MDTPDNHRPTETYHPTVARVVLIELGGATYDVLVPLSESGTMPNLAGLFQSAALARLRVGHPCSQSVAWATLESGGGPEVHGVLDDCYLDHRRRRLLPARTRPPACPTLGQWVTAGDRQPPAVQLADQPGGARIWQRKPSTFAELSSGIARTEAAIRGAAAAAGRIDRSTSWRLLRVRFALFDSLLHRLRHMLGIGGLPGGNRHWVAKTREAFRILDDCLGGLVELADQRGAAVVLVSPYGFGPFREKITLSELLRRRDLLEVAGGAARLGYRTARLAWRLRHGLSLGPASQSIGGLVPVDLRRSRAVSLHGQPAGLVYLNTPERFGTRVLGTRRQREQAKAELVGALREARHPITDELLFAEVFLTESRFRCDPLARFWPEVVAIPATGFYVRHRPDRNRHLMRPDCSLAAARTGDGLLMVRAADVVLGRPSTAALDDVAPTVLALLGLHPAASMTGRVVTELFAREPSPLERSHRDPVRTRS